MRSTHTTKKRKISHFSVLLSIIFALVLATGCSTFVTQPDEDTTNDETSSYNDATITLYRSGMFTMPEYARQNITITHEGIVTQYSHYNGTLTKREEITFSGDEYESILDSLESAKFFDMKAAYNSEVPVADVGFGVITVTTPAQSKSVRIDPFIQQGYPENVQKVIIAIQEAHYGEQELPADEPIEEVFKLQYQPMQCESTPWQEWYASGEIQFIQEPTQEELVEAYYNISGVTQLQQEMVCEACSVCPVGDYYVVSVTEYDANRLAELGWYRRIEPIACTMEAKICPDGSAVGRNGSNNCEFDPCPLES